MKEADKAKKTSSRSSGMFPHSELFEPVLFTSSASHTNDEETALEQLLFARAASHTSSDKG
jgi:hypothetical protein